RQPVREDTGKIDPDWNARKNLRVETDEIRKLAGVVSY
ncbi:hypothetical protein JCM8547_003731, partial [Rhodosporidiobolus lusitaniae]